jgi:hypothetical protein
MTLFPSGISHALCGSVMVITSKEVLPFGLVPITVIDIDVNYFEMNIK